MVGYIDMERQFFDALNSGGDDEEKKMDFLLKNVGWISREAVLKLLKVNLKVMKYHLPN